MPRKSKERLIYNSEFVGPKGRIQVINNRGIFILNNLDLDVRKIIYPGLNRDLWWDIKQLLVQVARALNIFEKKHPSYIAVLIFNQSSAYNSYNKGALNAFNINKSPSRIKKGKIKAYKRDIYFLLEYAFPELQGTIQLLQQLNKNGEKEPKGIEQILIKRGYNVPSLRFKCPEKTKYFAPLEYLLIIKQRYCLAYILLNYKDFF